jgi:uncharacterized protein YdhG (YjbR/CyaY superfamily)
MGSIPGVFVGGFSDFEKDAMKARAKELKAQERASKNKEELENALLATIAEMPEPDRSLSTRLHQIIKANAPTLYAKTWYGMPAYWNQEGKVVCFFQNAEKFKARYATIGFSDQARLDDGVMWPTSYALTELTADAESSIVALLKKALS